MIDASRDESVAGTDEGRRFRPTLVLALAFMTAFALAYRLDLATNGKVVVTLGLLLLVASSYLAVAHPNRLPLLLIAYLPYNAHFPVGLGESTSFNLTNLLLVLIAIAMLPARRKRLAFGGLEYLLVGFMALGFLAFTTTLSAHGGQEPLAELFRYKRWLTPFLLFFLVRRVTKDRTDLMDLVVALIYTSTLTGALTWWEGRELGGGSIDKSRIGGVMGQANTMGAFLVYYSLPAFALFLRTKHRLTRVLSLGCFLIMVRGMLFTLSRGAYLALAAGVATVLLVRNPLYLIVTASVAVGAPEYAPWLVPPSVTARLKSMNQPDIYDSSLEASIDKSGRQRLVLWDGAMGMVRDHPWRGVGLNRFGEVVGDYTEEVLVETDPHDAHNAYLKTAAELGVPALLVMILLLLWIGGTSVVQYFRRENLFDRSLALAVLGSLAGLAVSCLFGSRFADENLMGQFWMLVAALQALGRIPAGAEPENV